MRCKILQVRRVYGVRKHNPVRKSADNDNDPAPSLGHAHIESFNSCNSKNKLSVHTLWSKKCRMHSENPVPLTMLSTQCTYVVRKGNTRERNGTERKKTILLGNAHECAPVRPLRDCVFMGSAHLAACVCLCVFTPDRGRETACGLQPRQETPWWSGQGRWRHTSAGNFLVVVWAVRRPPWLWELPQPIQDTTPSFRQGQRSFRPPTDRPSHFGPPNYFIPPWRNAAPYAESMQMKTIQNARYLKK